MSAADLEIYMLQLVNVERAARGLAPLAWNGELAEAADVQADHIIAIDRLSHDGPGGSDLEARVRATDYPFGSSWRLGENVGYAELWEPEGLVDEVDLLHAGLMNSDGHRANILSDTSEIGIQLTVGDMGGFDAAVVAQVFGRGANGPFVTGVAYDDANGDGAYDPGEGVGGVPVVLTEVGTGRVTLAVTNAAGDYATETASGSYEVAFGLAGDGRAVTVGADNVGLDAAATAADGGATLTRLSDGANEFRWASRAILNDAFGPGTRLTLDDMDDGSQTTTSVRADGVVASIGRSDTASTHDWTRTTDHFDAAGRLERRETLFDDGDATTTLFENGKRSQHVDVDGSNSTNWTTRTQDYDAGGALSRRRYDWDDGDATVLSYAGGRMTERLNVDNTDGEAWATRTIGYGADGALSRRRYEWDDGDITELTYQNGRVVERFNADVSNEHAWTSRTITYDTDGSVLDRSYVWDGDGLA